MKTKTKIKYDISHAVNLIIDSYENLILQEFENLGRESVSERHDFFNGPKWEEHLEEVFYDIGFTANIDAIYDTLKVHAVSAAEKFLRYYDEMLAEEYAEKPEKENYDTESRYY